METVKNTFGARASRLAIGLLAGLLMGGGAACAAEPLLLKACADPDNLPFSSSTGNLKGFYLDLADHLASALGRTPEPVWHLTYFGQRAVRSTLLARECDLYIGLPADGDFMSQQVVMSKPFAVFSYALVLPAGLRVQGLADLRGRRVAVQFSSPPQNLLASIEGIQTVTVLSPEEGMRALAEGRADAAYLWGPSAGYLNKYTYAGRYQVVPTEGPAMSWRIAIGFRRADGALRERIQHELDTLGPWLGETEAKYGFPGAAPIRVAAATEQPVRLMTVGAVTEVLAQAAVPAAKAPAANGAALAHGHDLFNANCAHCHGTDAAAPEKRVDLRRLHTRYGDTMDEVFSTTVHNGRPAKGMPVWKGVLSEADIASIKTYIDSIQQSN
jgi:polar amino acid transport system substrate-binding protein